MASPRRGSHVGNGTSKPLTIDASLREPYHNSNGSASKLSPAVDSPFLPPTNSPGLAPPSAGAFATNFEVLQSPASTPRTYTFPTSVSTPSPPLGIPSINLPPPSPSTPSLLVPLGHRRVPSVSYTHTPSSPSSPSFPVTQRRVPSISFSSQLSPSGSNGTIASSPFSASGKRHGRIHSRNLSVFFPRPENAASTAIAEDETVPSLGATSPSRLGDGPIFGHSAIAGTKSEGSSLTTGLSNNPNMSKRRGHHHRHSLSHSFVNFAESGAEGPTDAPSPMDQPEASSPFIPRTPSFEDISEKSRRGSSALPRTYRSSPQNDLASLARGYRQESAVAFAIFEFLTGAGMWVAGQSRGSLACTGLGYWIVFDASSVALASKAFPWLPLSDRGQTSTEAELRRPFGIRRLETTVAFSQSIYLLFSGVYVFKEAVEHFLLASSEESHHHHHGGEGINGIVFPAVLLWISLAAVLFSNVYYRNHAQLAVATGPLPDPSTVLESVPFIRRSVRNFLSRLQKNPRLFRLASNPFTLAPASFSIALLYTTYIADVSQHITLDMLISTLETIWTFSIAYPTAVALGRILLQTAPERPPPGSGGPMEVFLRAMREIERHPDIVHLPAPNFWQLTLPRGREMGPTASTHSSGQDLVASEAELVATIELHVRKSLSDTEILSLTKWANDKCSAALGRPRVGNVSVAVVRG